MAGCVIFKHVNCSISPDLGFKSSEQVSWDHINIYIDLLIKFACVLNGSTFSHRTLCSARVQIFQASTPTPLYTSPSYNTSNKNFPSFGLLIFLLSQISKKLAIHLDKLWKGWRKGNSKLYQIVHSVPVILEKNHGAQVTATSKFIHIGSSSGVVGEVALVRTYHVLTLKCVNTPAPSKGCQLDPKGWWFDTLQEPFGTLWKVQAGIISSDRFTQLFFQWVVGDFSEWESWDHYFWSTWSIWISYTCDTAGLAEIIWMIRMISIISMLW